MLTAFFCFSRNHANLVDRYEVTGNRKSRTEKKCRLMILLSRALGSVPLCMLADRRLRLLQFIPSLISSLIITSLRWPEKVLVFVEKVVSTPPGYPGGENSWAVVFRLIEDEKTWNFRLFSGQYNGFGIVLETSHIDCQNRNPVKSAR